MVVTKLELETRAVLTPLQILDWFYNLGFSVYDVQVVARVRGDKDHEYVYLVTTGDLYAWRAIRDLQGQKIGGFPAVVRLAKTQATGPRDIRV
jgi:hypothetical protein